jgi:hypothetical protein
LPEAAPSGFRELMIAREDLQEPQRMVDPDGNRVQLVPKGFDGVTQLGVAMAVRSLGEHRRFYGDLLGFAEQSWSGGPAFRLGDSLLLLAEHWDVIQDEATREQSRSGLPMFGDKFPD